MHIKSSDLAKNWARNERKEKVTICLIFFKIDGVSLYLQIAVKFNEFGFACDR
jgi:hypothetical protein